MAEVRVGVYKAQFLRVIMSEHRAVDDLEGYQVKFSSNLLNSQVTGTLTALESMIWRLKTHGTTMAAREIRRFRNMSTVSEGAMKVWYKECIADLLKNDRESIESKGFVIVPNRYINSYVMNQLFVFTKLEVEQTLNAEASPRDRGQIEIDIQARYISPEFTPKPEDL